MISALVQNRLRECLRRPLPYVVASGVLLLAAASRALIGFSFGAEARAVSNLVISAVFLAGLLHAALLATASVNRDFERGTLGFLLAKPVSPAAYLLGSFFGLFLGAVVICVATGISTLGLLALAGIPGGAAIPIGALVWACFRALLLIAVLEAAGLLASCLFQRVAAPLALFAFFALASLGTGTIAPAFGLFGLDVASSPSAALLALYALLWSTILLLVAYIVLGFRATPRTHS